MGKLILKEESTPPTTPATDTVVIYPKSDGKVYAKDDLGAETQLSNSGGDVVGPASATADAIARYSGTTGKLIKNSGSVINDSGHVGINTASPNSFFHASGSVAYKTETITSNKTLGINDSTILADATSGNIIVTLPAVSTCLGRVYDIKKIDTSANLVTVVGNGAELIDLAANKILVLKNDSIEVLADSTGWKVHGYVKSSPFAQLSSNASQQPANTSPTLVTMNSNDFIRGITHSTSTNTHLVTIIKAGSYFIIAAGQVGKTSGATSNNVNIWMRQNGTDIVNSNTRQNILATTDTAVLVSQVVTECAAGDTISVVFSISVTGQGAGLIAISPAGEPVIPAIIFTIFEV